ncbi:MAG: Serine/threonine-protein kinase PknB [Candidatus Parcubacteria bacterium]
MRAPACLIAAVAALTFSCATAAPDRNGAGHEPRFTGDGSVLNVLDNVQSFDISDDLRTVVAARHVAVNYNWSLYALGTGRMGADGPLCHHEFDPEGVAFYGSTSRIVTISNDGFARLWDVVRGKETWSLRVDPYKRKLYGLTVSDDGLIAFCDERGNVTVTSPEEGAGVVSWKAHDGECRALKFSPDGGFLFSGGWDKTVAVWSVDGGTLVARVDIGAFVNDLDLDPKGKILAVATSVDRPELNFEIGKAVLAGTYGTVEEGNGVTVLDASTGDIVARFSGPRGPAMAVAVSPDGRTVAAGGWDFVVRLFSVPGKRATSAVVVARHVQQLRFLRDGSGLMVANWIKPFTGGTSLAVYGVSGLE